MADCNPSVFRQGNKSSNSFLQFGTMTEVIWFPLEKGESKSVSEIILYGAPFTNRRLFIHLKIKNSNKIKKYYVIEIKQDVDFSIVHIKSLSCEF